MGLLDVKTTVKTADMGFMDRLTHEWFPSMAPTITGGMDEGGGGGSMLLTKGRPLNNTSASSENVLDAKDMLGWTAVVDPKSIGCLSRESRILP